MSKDGLYWKFNAIFLFVMTFITKTLALEDNTLQYGKYDYIDVAKTTASGRSKGQTTRIFTTGNELDEEFWLKYLGEDFRRAVHLHVDDNNNFMQPIEDTEPQRQLKKYSDREEKRTRFVRQPLQDNNNKHLTVKSSCKENKEKYPTEKPETFNETTNSISLHDDTHHHDHQDSNNIFSKTKTSKHNNKLLIHDNIYKQKIFKTKPSNILKALHEPIVIKLPEINNSEQQINEEHGPVVFQIPPVIYHRKANLYPENISNRQLFMHDDEIPNLSLGNRDQVQITRINNQHHHNADQLSRSKVIYHRRPNLLYPEKIFNRQLFMHDDEIPNLSLGNREQVQITRINNQHHHNTDQLSDLYFNNQNIELHPD